MIMNFIHKNLAKPAFLIFSYGLNIVFIILDLMPYFIRDLFFKLFFKKYGKNVMIDYKTFFRYLKNIEIYNNVSINRGCEFYTTVHYNTKIILNDNVTISPHVKFYSAGHDYNYFNLPVTSSDIVVGKNVWIGANSVILQGVVIGEGSIVCSGSVVNKSIPPYSMVAGVPAKIIKQDLNRL